MTTERHVILATGGHVDHGKTALVKALTGSDCDTHKEEKERGLTINLGFAHLDLPSGASAGVVDVPGHKDFVHTMAAGMGGVDATLLVIAADSGVMPQTVEHLEIMQAVGLRAGMIVLTRIDLAEDEATAMAEEEARELAKGTFLENAPIVKVSPVTGKGMDNLVNKIDRLVSNLPYRIPGDVFRMFADRLFTIKGFGPVFTGSVLSGSLKTGDSVCLLPSNSKPARVRRIERHHGEVQKITAGDRAAVNPVGTGVEFLENGMMLSDRPLKDTIVLDARIETSASCKQLKRQSRLKLHLGTCETMARVTLMNREELGSSQTAYARLKLSDRCVARHGDRFVLRDPSRRLTVGGGLALDTNPGRGRYRLAVRKLEMIEEFGLKGLAMQTAAAQGAPVDQVQLAKTLNYSEREILEALSDEPPDGFGIFRTGQLTCVAPQDYLENLGNLVVKTLSAHHAKHPLSESGITAAELRLQHGETDSALFNLILEDMAERGILKPVGRTWALASHSVELNDEDREAIGFAQKILADSGTRALTANTFREEFADKGMPPMDVKETLEHLVASGGAYKIENHYLNAHVVDHARKVLLRALEESPEGVTAAEFRDLLKANRKSAILLMTLFDTEGATKRKGDKRVLANGNTLKKI